MIIKLVNPCKIFRTRCHYYFILNLNIEHKNKELRVHITTAPSYISLGSILEPCLKNLCVLDLLCMDVTMGIYQTGGCLFSGMLILREEFFTENPIQLLSHQ